MTHGMIPPTRVGLGFLRVCELSLAHLPLEGRADTDVAQRSTAVSAVDMQQTVETTVPRVTRRDLRRCPALPAVSKVDPCPQQLPGHLRRLRHRKARRKLDCHAQK